MSLTIESSNLWWRKEIQNTTPEAEPTTLIAFSHESCVSRVIAWVVSFFGDYEQISLNENPSQIFTVKRQDLVAFMQRIDEQKTTQLHLKATHSPDWIQQIINSWNKKNLSGLIDQIEQEKVDTLSRFPTSSFYLTEIEEIALMSQDNKVYLKLQLKDGKSIVRNLFRGEKDELAKIFPALSNNNLIRGKELLDQINQNQEKIYYLLESFSVNSPIKVKGNSVYQDDLIFIGKCRQLYRPNALEPYYERYLLGTHIDVIRQQCSTSIEFIKEAGVDEWTIQNAIQSGNFFTLVKLCQIKKEEYLLEGQPLDSEIATHLKKSVTKLFYFITSEQGKEKAQNLFDLYTEAKMQLLTSDIALVEGNPEAIKNNLFFPPFSSL